MAPGFVAAEEGSRVYLFFLVCVGFFTVLWECSSSKMYLISLEVEECMLNKHKVWALSRTGCVCLICRKGDAFG